MLVEISVDSHRHVMADTHHSTKGICAETEVSVLTHILEALSLLLHRIVVAAETINLDAFALNLNGLSLTKTLHQSTHHADASTCGNLSELIGIDLGWVDYYLNIINSRTIVKSDKIDCFATTMGTYPSLYIHD